ncbi:uncharacterized protein TNCV_1855861 [Trichonephila clavipes]|nr:uncharacterized protein TNCV_1855861 [Trichonephila clavipes]
MVEKAIGISKNIIKKAREDRRDYLVGLIEYRNTPISGLDLSPAQTSSRCRPSSFPTLPKLIWCSSWGCNLGQSLSNHGPHVFYRRKIRRASRLGKQFNLVIDEEPLDNACHVWSRIILLKYGCSQALKIRKDNWLLHLGDVELAA